ncbi:MAG: hypothetical protein IKZ29_08090 [Clostridiales bacterium]|nr:hypothetical protein [Clostridiales bacterium]
MGSGSSSSYNDITTGSQPYAPTYSVTKDMLKKDMKDSDIYNPNTGYFHNPSAQNLEESIRDGDIYSGEEKADTSFPYVLDTAGNIIFGKRANPNNPEKRSPHPTLIGGKDPKVQCAGIIKITDGKIVSVDNRSGHFKPNELSMKKVYNALEDLRSRHPEVFSPKYKGGN